MYKTTKSLQVIKNTEYGMYGLISANGFSEYLTGKDILGNELTTSQRQASLSLGLAGILPTAIELTPASKGVTKDITKKAHERVVRNTQSARAFVDHWFNGLVSQTDVAMAGGPRLPINAMRDTHVQQEIHTSFAKVTKGTGETVKKIGEINDPIRTYRGADLGKLEAKYTADPRLTVEMPYVGKGQKNTNVEGWLRDKDFYWKEMLEKYPEAFNRSNRQKIELGFAPINNPTFRKHFPQYDLKELYNDTLIHHHIGGGGQAVTVPSKLHPGLGGIHNAEKSAGVWGNDQKYAELLEKFLEK
ncbi:hypothetical protein [Paraliobacillus sp. JSM ZJ581]|uniref:hypothetical protein n=1 Tax=Paraliobacillus sp. JSM ZJ581 TaxID=3342118 RepID=UPI0035A819CF